MDIDSSLGSATDTTHLIISLPNGDELKHKQVPNSETLWNILKQFESQKNQNLCKKYNKDNRYELPCIYHNNYPFAATLSQLLSTKLFDITKHKKSNNSIIKLKLIFSTQAFSISELNTKIKTIENQLLSKEKQTDIKNNDSDDEQNKSKLDKDFAMDIDPIEAQSTEEIFRKMEMLLYKLCKLLITKEEFISCMKLLRKVVNNLIIHPLDKPDDKKKKDPSKYRKLNLKNDKLQNNLFKYTPALDILLLIGFQKKDNLIILSPENENIVIFQALIVKIENCQPPKPTIPIVEKNIKIYTLQDLQKFKVEEAKKIAQENANKNIQSEPSLASAHRRAAQNAYKKNHPTQLMGKELREKKYGVKQKVYKFTVLRIEFPSKYVLEAKFHPSTAIYKLFEFVNGFLDLNVSKLKYQLLLPPHQIIKNVNNDNITFKSMGGMIPACTIRFVLDPKKNKNISYTGNYINNEYINKYLTKNMTSLRASSFVDNEEKNNDDNKSNISNNNNNNSKKSGKSLAEFKAWKRKQALLKKYEKLGK